MTKFLILLVALLTIIALGCSSNSPAAVSSSSAASASPANSPAVPLKETEAKIIELEKLTWELYKEGKFKEGENYEAKGLQATWGGQVKSSEAGTEEAKGFKILKMEYSNWKVTFPRPDVAVVTYSFHEDALPKDIGGDYVASAVWLQINGDWKMALYHSSRAKK